MSQLVDDLIATTENVNKIINSPEEYVKAMDRINELTKDMSLPTSTRFLASRLGRVINEQKNSPIRAVIADFVQQLEQQEKDREAAERDAEQREAEVASETVEPSLEFGTKQSKELAFGTLGYIVIQDKGVRIIYDVTVINCDESQVCCSDMDGDVHWVPRSGFFTEYYEANG